MGDNSILCSRRHIKARPPPGRMPPQSARKSARHAWAGGGVGEGWADGAAAGLPPEPRAATADWHAGERDDIFERRHCREALPPVGTLAHIAW